VNGEPVGRILEENVLSQTDCDLLSFAGSSALVTVRWLLYLGANAEVADGNNTSALHAACRSGSLVLVKQFIKQTVLLNSQDVAGWTPLHIAAHMGRKAVALRLLQARADPSIVNSRGLKPADLCKDTGTYQVIVRFSGGEQANGPRPFARGVLGGSSPSPANAFHDEEADEAGEALSDLVGLPQQCEPELFFVNPRPVFHHTAVHRKALLSLASAIFNLQPSHGLALVVLMGLEESYTGAMKVLLKHGAVSRQLAGSFLGEPLSVCPLIRFSYFDGLPLLNTGVVSCLRTVFSSLGIPQELQKLDRLLWAIASVWWRKHKALRDSGRAVAIKQQPRANHLGAEFTGLELLSYLSSQEVLYQLLYSSVLLHRRVWGGYSSVPLGPMDLETWAELNSGIERHGEDDVPMHVQTRIFTDISTSRVPELSAWERGNLALVTQNGVGAESIPEEALPGPIGAATDAYLAAESRK
ncbi:PPP1R12B, partial [Symbiodinium sp. CCMP2456]